MKCQRNASPYSACFASRSCARFSPTTPIPASASTARSATDTYFVAATIVTCGPASAWTRSYLARISAGDSTDDALCPAHGAVAPVREEEIAAAARAEIDAVDVGDACTTQRPLRSRPQVEDPPVRQVVVESARDLPPPLVAARPHGRPDDGRLRSVSERGHARLDDALREPAPPGVQHGERRPGTVARDGDGNAVGGERDHRQPG